jgi:hypothetical protein
MKEREREREREREKNYFILDEKENKRETKEKFLMHITYDAGKLPPSPLYKSLE